LSSFNISLDNKPNLAQAFQDDPALAKQVVSTFVNLMEESFDPEKGIRWADLPKILHHDLDFTALVRGILRGSLDLKDINPETYDALKVEVHPLAMLQSRKNHLDGGLKLSNWRLHFRLPEDASINEETVAKMFRTMLRHTKYIKIDILRQHLEYNQVATYRGLGDVQMEKMPFFPAVLYQRQQGGDLQVGKFLDSNGFLDCGTITAEVVECPACKMPEQMYELDGNHQGCLHCSAGYTVVDNV
jgi:hypothetical protein